MTDDGEHIDENVPVYEPAYPDHVDVCEHPNCERSCDPRARICDECTLVMQPGTKDICDHCGDFLRRNPEESS